TLRTWNRDHTVRIKPQTVGIAKPGCQYISPLPVGRDSHESLIARDGVEVAVPIPLQATDIVMPRRRRFEGVAEALVEVGLTIAVDLAKSSELIPALDEDRIAIDE